VVTPSKDADFELVAKPDAITLHGRHHDGKPMSLSQTTAKITLMTAGKKSEAQLAPAGDTLQATGNFEVAKGTVAIALVTLPGKQPVSVRFKVK
jgi:hypothetical protein